MPIKKKHICRFGVRSEDGRSSDIWRNWTSTRGNKSDVYLAPRALAGRLKVSMHETGKCQLSFTKEFLGEIADLGTWTRESRHLARWELGQLSPGVTLAIRLIVPTSELIKAPIVETSLKPVFWVPAAPLGKAVEFSAFLTTPHAKVSGWPGKRAMATALLEKVILANQHTLWIVYRTVDSPEAAIAQIADIEAIQKKAVRLDSRNEIDFLERQLRVLLMGWGENGTCYLVEAAFPTSKGRDI